jgi:hypothetical protein
MPSLRPDRETGNEFACAEIGERSGRPTARGHASIQNWQAVDGSGVFQADLSRNTIAELPSVSDLGYAR